MNSQHANGFTLIELIIAVVIIGSSLTGIMLAIVQGTFASADPLINQQAIIIASSYLEEATLQPYSDPDGGETGSCEEGAVNRSLFDDITDYDCINDNNGAQDHFGSLITGLDSYNVIVNVSTTSIGTPPVSARRIDVTVSHDTFTAINITLTGYRTGYY